MSAALAVDPAVLERDLRRRVADVRLVAEIGLDAALRGDLIAGLRRVLGRGAGQPDQLARSYPALLVVYLVAEGVYRYRSGTFWGLLALGRINKQYGPAFEDALDRLGLERFQELVIGERALRFVAPILAHGGIPQSCLSEFFSLLDTDLRRRAVDARDLLTLWRTRQSRFDDIAKPVQRFLTYGGELAFDLVDRCVDLMAEHARTGRVPSPEEAGLPPYVIGGFTQYVRRVGDVDARSVRSELYPRPRIRLDPWDPRGPMLELPALPPGVQGPFWQVETGEGVRRVQGSRTESRSVLLSPARSWAVELHDGENERLLRRTVFEGFDPVPAAVFESVGGRLLDLGSGVRAAEAWLLTPRTVHVGTLDPTARQAALRILEQAPEPTGPWTGYRLEHVDLEEVRYLTVTDGAGVVEQRVRVLRPAERPELDGHLLDGVSTVEGLPVYTDAPRVILPEVASSGWRVRLRGRAGTPTQVVEHIVGRRLLPLHELMDGSLLHVVDLAVQGHLGSDLRTAFAVVPGLQVTRPGGLLLPGDRADPVMVTVPAPLRAGGEASCGPLVVPVPDGQDEVEAMVAGPGADAGAEVKLRITVPRVLWGLVRADDPSLDLSDRPVVIDAADLAAGLVSALVVRCRRVGLQAVLTLYGPEGIVQRSHPAASAGHDGRWVFDLTRFVDSVRSSGQPRLKLLLEVDSRSAVTADIRTRLDVRDIRAHSRLHGDYAEVALAYDGDQPLRGRVVRLWSEERPWASPIVERVPDGQLGHLEIGGYGRVPPGHYLAQVAVDDDWTVARRPLPGAPNVGQIQVGDGSDLARWQAALDVSDPLAVLEVAAATGKLPRHLEPAELRELTSPLLDTAVARLDAPGGTTSIGFKVVASLLLADPIGLASAISEVAGTNRYRRGWAVDLTIDLLQHVRVGVASPLTESAARILWQVCPALAAGLELVWPIDGQRIARCQEFLGWDPAQGLAAIATGTPVDQAWAGMPADQLEDIQRTIELVPRQLLTLDALVAANFEWLLAEKRGDRAPIDWWYAHRGDLTAFEESQSDVVRAHLAARMPQKGSIDWAALPAVTLGAALQLMSRGPAQPRAARALRQAAGFAPKLVVRDLVIAVILLRADPACDRTDQDRRQ